MEIVIQSFATNPGPVCLYFDDVLIGTDRPAMLSQRESFEHPIEITFLTFVNDGQRHTFHHQRDIVRFLKYKGFDVTEEDLAERLSIK